MPTITPFLWFSDNAEDAITFYCGLFPDATLVDAQRGPDGRFFTGTFELAGRRFMALNGGPMYTINEAISLFVSCEDQAEIDHYWDALAAGGKPLRCGWITDRFGVTWQIIPKSLGNFLGGPDREAASRARAAMMAMVKLDIAALQAAYDGR